MILWVASDKRSNMLRMVYSNPDYPGRPLLHRLIDLVVGRFILIVNVRPLSVCLLLTVYLLFRISLWPSVGKELSPCLFTFFFFFCFSAVLNDVGVPFPFGV